MQKTGSSGSRGPIIVFAVVFLGFAYIYPKADAYINRIRLTINSPVHDARIKGDSITLSGSIKPKDAQLRFWLGKYIDVKKGRFSERVAVPDSVNIVRIDVYRKGELKESRSLRIIREFSPEELAERTKRRIEERKAELAYQAAIAKKERDELLRWWSTKAGKIHKKHPEWSREDCERLAEGSIWIGMHLNMLKYKRGLPDAANPSNYGSGTQWQWCWDDWTPSCFYDDNNDGLIDSYN